MTLEANKALARRSIALWASDATDRPEDVFAPGYFNHQESGIEGGVTTHDLAGWKQLVDGFRVSFSDVTTEVTMQIAEGDQVASRWQFTALHTGDFMGAAPTGKRLTWTGIYIDRCENGRIVETWVDWDKYRLFQGVGLVP